MMGHSKQVNPSKTNELKSNTFTGPLPLSSNKSYFRSRKEGELILNDFGFCYSGKCLVLMSVCKTTYNKVYQQAWIIKASEE